MSSAAHKSDRRNSLRRWFKAISLVLVTAPALVLLWAYYCLDSLPPDDGDLRLPVVSVPDASNGLRLLAQAAAGIDWHDELIPREEGGGGEADTSDRTLGDQLEEFAGGRGWDQKLVSEALARNRSVLEKIDQAIAAEHFASPPIIDLEQKLFESVVGARRAYFLAALRVGERHTAGDDRAALNEALKLIRLGKRLEDAGGPLIHYLIASAISAFARECLTRLVAQARLSTGDLQDAVHELERLKPQSDVLRSTFLAEYAYVGLVIDAIAQGKAPLEEADLTMGPKLAMPVWPWRSRHFFLANHSKQLAAELNRAILKAVPTDGPWQPVRWQAFLDLAPNRWLPGRNGVGRHALCSAVDVYRRVLERYQNSQLQHQFVRLTVALKGFQTTHGALPERLAEMVPEWIVAEPEDPFCGQPLRYDRSRRVLWSIGNDGKDSGGKLEPASDSSDLDLSEPTAVLPFE